MTSGQIAWETLRSAAVLSIPMLFVVLACIGMSVKAGNSPFKKSTSTKIKKKHSPEVARQDKRSPEQGLKNGRRSKKI